MQKDQEIEVSPEYIIKMQKEGMLDAYQGAPPDFPDCPYYMMGYNSVSN
jgi:hypothetical protein